MFTSGPMSPKVANRNAIKNKKEEEKEEKEEKEKLKEYKENEINRKEERRRRRESFEDKRTKELQRIKDAARRKSTCIPNQELLSKKWSRGKMIGEGKDEEKKGGESDDEVDSDASTVIPPWEAPEVNPGDNILLIQFPDLHDNSHPRTLKVVVYKVEPPHIYYRVDPQLDTHRFASGSILLKKYPEEVSLLGLLI